MKITKTMKFIPKLFKKRWFFKKKNDFTKIEKSLEEINQLIEQTSSRKQKNRLLKGKIFLEICYNCK